MDYETNRSLNDVGVFLTIDEAEELLAYVRRLKDVPSIQHVHLTELSGQSFGKEITVSLTSPNVKKQPRELNAFRN